MFLCSDSVNLRYVMGHTHCNKVVEEGVGFMVAGQGMEGCGNYGFSLFETHGDDGGVEITYFPIDDNDDRFEATRRCFEVHGAANCKEKFGVRWL